MITRLLILHCLFAAPQETPRPVCMIVIIRGQAEIRRADQETPVVLTKKKYEPYLLEGDRITVAQKSKLRVRFFRDDHLEDLEPGGFLVEKNGCLGLDGATVKKPAVARFANPYLRSGLATMKQGSGRGAGVLLRSLPSRTEESVSFAPPVTPLRGELILDDRPRLAWPAVEGVEQFVVRLTKAGSGEVVWNLQTDQTHIDFPSDQPQLKQNRSYDWEVRKLLPNGLSERLWSSGFMVGLPVPQRELEEIGELARSDEPFDLLLAVAAYDELGMSSRALETCQRLTKIASENTHAWRLLSDYYDKAGRLQDAQAAYKKALELGFVPPSSEDKQDAQARE